MNAFASPVRVAPGAESVMIGFFDSAHDRRVDTDDLPIAIQQRPATRTGEDVGVVKYHLKPFQHPVDLWPHPVSTEPRQKKGIGISFRSTPG
jgi:hypothetical protein